MWVCCAVNRKYAIEKGSLLFRRTHCTPWKMSYGLEQIHRSNNLCKPTHTFSQTIELNRMILLPILLQLYDVIRKFDVICHIIRIHFGKKEIMYGPYSNSMQPENKILWIFRELLLLLLFSISVFTRFLEFVHSSVNISVAPRVINTLLNKPKSLLCMLKQFCMFSKRLEPTQQGKIRIWDENSCFSKYFVSNIGLDVIQFESIKNTKLNKQMSQLLTDLAEFCVERDENDRFLMLLAD